MKVITPPFRASYPSLFKPKMNEMSKKEEYSVVALFKKGEDLRVLKGAFQAACEKKWGPDPKKWPKNLKSPFRDQKEKEREDESGKMVLPEGYEEGAIFMNFKSKDKPGVVDAARKPIQNEADIYPGCWLRASVSAYAYDQAGNKGVAFGLQNIQKVKDDQPLGGGKTSAQNDFDALETESSGAAGDFGSFGEPPF